MKPEKFKLYHINYTCDGESDYIGPAMCSSEIPDKENDYQFYIEATQQHQWFPEYAIFKMPENQAKHDPVNHPSHYTSHPSGVECIAITQHMNFCLGNAIKYIWRAGMKSDNAVEDLQKAIFYLNTEIERLNKFKLP